MANYDKAYHKGTQFDLVETCEMIAWYLIGAKNKDICAAYSISRQSFQDFLHRYHVPRKANNEHREAIRRAARDAWRIRTQCNVVTTVEACDSCRVSGI